MRDDVPIDRTALGVVRGDITRVHVDAANSAPSGGGGVNGAIHAPPAPSCSPPAAPSGGAAVESTAGVADRILSFLRRAPGRIPGNLSAGDVHARHACENTGCIDGPRICLVMIGSLRCVTTADPGVTS